MSQPDDPKNLRDEQSVIGWIDSIADRFEAAWKATSQGAPRPQIENYLDQAVEPRRSLLLQELIELDVIYRVRLGERPTPEEYVNRFESLNLEWVRQVIAASPPLSPSGERGRGEGAAAGANNQSPNPAAGLQTHTKRVRCPHCQCPIQLVDDRPDEVLCPSCGSSFRLRDSRITSTVAYMRQLGKFQLMERLGLGAFGAVWKARDTVLDKIVAVKIPHAGSLESEGDRARFFREARAAAQLRHPGIVAVHEIAELETEVGKVPAIVSDFVDGVTLRDLLTQRRLTFRESADLLAQLADALDYAHSMKVIHRDIKPANIILDYPPGLGLGAPLDEDSSIKTLPLPPGEGRGEGTSNATDRPHLNPLPKGERTMRTRLARPRPMILDFGLALRDEAEATMTIDGQILGTPAYMSPEQAAGFSHTADARSDVYALGVILYELLCGELPFRGSRASLLRQIQNDEPRPPCRVNDKIPRDLETICLKSLSKSSARRYQTARELADDLRHWLRGEPITARPVTSTERLVRWCQRNPVVAFLIATAVTLLVAVAVISIVSAARLKDLADLERDAAQRASRNADAAVRQTKLAERLLYAAHMNLAQDAWEDARVGQTIRLLDLYRPATGQEGGAPDLRGFEWFYWDRLCHNDLLTLKGHAGAVLSVAFSADGKRLASASQDQTVKVWDARSGQETLTLKKQTAQVHSVAFSPDGKRLASANFDQTVKIWDTTSGQETLTLKGHTAPVWSVAFSADGKRLASASLDQTVKLWDATNGQETLTLKGHTGEVMSVAFCADGKQLASASVDQTVKVWDAVSGQETLSLKGHTSEVYSVAFTPDGKRLASASGDRTVKLWDATSGQETLTLNGHTGVVTSVAFSADGKLLASASLDQMVIVWDAVSGHAALTLKGHTSEVYSVAFTLDGKRLASASNDGKVKVWDAVSGQETLTLNGHTKRILNVAFSPDGRRLASASVDQTVKVWDAMSGQETLTLKGHTSEVYSLAFTPDGKRLASASADRTVKLWDATSGQETLTLNGHTGVVTSVAFTADGRWLASASGEYRQPGVMKLWDATSGQEMLTLKGHASEVYSVAFSPDGKRLASASFDKTVKVWDATSGQETLTLKGHTREVYSVAFSPDGNRLASAGADRTVKLWDALSGQEIRTLNGHDHVVTSVAFNADGKRLATASVDQTVKLWDASSGQEMLTLKGHTDEVLSVAFSPDGNRLASAGSNDDRTIKVWDARPWTVELMVEQQAVNVIRFLFGKGLSKADVIQSLAADETINDLVRHRATELARDWK